MIKPKVVLLIFVSGKIVLTGAKVIVFLLFFFITMQLLAVFGISPSLVTSSVVLVPVVDTVTATWMAVSTRSQCRVQWTRFEPHPLTLFCLFLSTIRSEKRSTRLSTRFIPCCANSVSHSVGRSVLVATFLFHVLVPRRTTRARPV